LWPDFEVFGDGANLVQFQKLFLLTHFLVKGTGIFILTTTFKNVQNLDRSNVPFN